MKNTSDMTLAELRAMAKDMDPTAREQFLASVFDDVTMRGTDERAFLTICQHIYRENDGSNTPFESLVVGLVLHHARQAATRAIVRMEFEQFDRDWRDAIYISRWFYRQHGEMVTTEKLKDIEDLDIDFAEIENWAR